MPQVSISSIFWAYKTCDFFTEIIENYLCLGRMLNPIGWNSGPFGQGSVSSSSANLVP